MKIDGLAQGDYANYQNKLMIINSSFNNNKIVIPKCIKEIYFSGNFNCCLRNVIFHPKIKTLYFQGTFNKPINDVIFPDSIKSIEFCGDFNQPLFNVVLPKKIEKLKFGKKYNHSLKQVKLPQSLNQITVYNNEILKDVELPYTVEYLEFNKIPENIKLTKFLKNLSISHLNKDFDNVELPESLETINIQKVSTNIYNIPSNIKEIVIGDNYKNLIKKIPFECKLSVIEY